MISLFEDLYKNIFFIQNVFFEFNKIMICNDMKRLICTDEFYLCKKVIIF